LAAFPRGLVKQVQASALSLSQATESGTLYALSEIAALTQIAHEAGLQVHMDGARFANSIASLGCSPADMTWRAGVDVLSLGASKNGTIACEAVVFFNPQQALDFAFRRKRGGHTLSKGRFLAAQMNAWLNDDHWLDLASRANAHAQALAHGLRQIEGVRLPWPVQINEVFAILPQHMDAALKSAGARYYDWPARRLAPAFAPGANERFVRLLTSFSTPQRDVEKFIEIARKATRG
jgi:threonine aldolase